MIGFQRILLIFENGRWSFRPFGINAAHFAKYSNPIFDNVTSKWAGFCVQQFFSAENPTLAPVWKCTRKSRAAIHKFLCVETASTLLYAKETTTAQLWRQFCFPDRLVILNEDRTLSNDQEKGFCRNSRKCSDCRAFSFFKTLPQLPGI